VTTLGDGDGVSASVGPELGLGVALGLGVGTAPGAFDLGRRMTPPMTATTMAAAPMAMRMFMGVSLHAGQWARR
jgi:hypothetical protein